MLLTYPRSGSHYLRDLVKQKLDTELEASHNWDEATGVVITIARDPYDSIHSAITMTRHYDQPLDIKRMVNSYAYQHGFLYNRANVVIDYNTLVKNTDLVVKTLSDILDKPINEHIYHNEMTDHPEENYLVSSLTSPLYKEDYLKGYDLTEAYRVYNLLLSRKSV